MKTRRLKRGTEEAKKSAQFRGSEQARLAPVAAEDLENKTGAQWDIVIIEAGVSLNGRYFSPEVLQKRAQAFEGVRVFAYAFGDTYHHLPGLVREQRPESFAQNFVGFVDGVHYATFEKPDGRQGEGLVGRFHVTDPWWRSTYLNLAREGGGEIPGFSIDYVYESMPGTVDGQSVDVVVDIPHVYALDVVTHPAAGGRLLRAVAGFFSHEAPSHQQTKGGKQNMDREKLLALLKKLRGERGLEGVDVEKATEAELWALLEQTVGEWAKEHGKEESDPAVKGLLGVVGLLKDGKKDEAKAAFEQLAPQFGLGRESKPEPKPEPVKKDEPKVDPEASRAVEELLERLRIRESNFVLRERLAAEDKLPKAAKEQIEARFRDRAFESAELDGAIQEYKDFLAKIDPTGQVVGLGSQAKHPAGHVQMGREEADKLQAAMDLMMGYEPEESEKRAYEGVKPFRGLQEAYVRMTGDAEVRGVIDRDRLLRGAEADSSDFPNALSTSMHKRMVKEYRRLSHNWRPLVEVTSLSNFKTHDAVRWGGFTNLSIVSEDGEYQHLSEPSEEKASYAAAKRGNLFYVTREMIKNDDLRAVRKFPLKIAQAATRTLAQFVFDLLINYGGVVPAINGGTIYDTKALYHTDHNNLLTDPLDFDSFGKARTMMRKQTEADSGEVLGLEPGFLVVPIDLENTARIILQSERRPGVMDNDVNIHRNAAQLIVSPYLRGDEDNWFMVANPMDTETIEIGFIDGREEPEILIQDRADVGTVFTHDRITWKVRHEYGGAVIDYRGFVGSIVA